MDNLFPVVLALGILGLVALGVFLVFRAFWLWYWRIDAIVARLEQIRDAVELINARDAGRAMARVPSASYATRPVTVPASPEARAAATARP